MNALEEFHQRLEESEYDITHEHLINKELQEVNDKLAKEGLEDILAQSEIERQAYAIRKSFDYDEEKKGFKGLSWQMSGTAKNQDGKEMPFVWPDISTFSEDDFDYLEKRYKEANNLYTKTDFGQILFFQKPTTYSKHNDFKKKLCFELFELAKKYQASIGPKEENYALHMLKTIKSALLISIQCRLNEETKEISEWIQDVHSKWEVSRKYTLPVLLDLSQLVIDNFKILNEHFNVRRMLEKNLEGLDFQQKTYTWGAIDVVNTSYILDQKAGLDLIDYKRKKAQLYEQLADEAEGTPRQLAAISFVETALRIYRELKDDDNIKKLEDRYQKIRGTGEFGTVREELDPEQVKVISNNIQKEIESKTPQQIVHTLSFSPMFPEIGIIKKNSEEAFSNNITLSLFPSSVVDKFGNTIAIYSTEEEKRYFSFLQTYDFYYQTGVQWLIYYFLKAFRADKLTYDITLQFLEGTWFNDSIERTYSDKTLEVKPIEIIKQPLRLFFSELKKIQKDKDYDFNFVVLNDSLILKVEAILRYMCERMGIATFKPRPRGIVMEKNLDDLLADLKHSEDSPTGFDENDRFFLKFVLSEKMGRNMRNKIAHGLMDINEYGLDNIIVAFTMILRISKYKINKDG